MKNTTKIEFRHEGVIYTTDKGGYYYAQPIGGIKKRISKDAFNKAYTDYVNATVTDEEWQAQADAEKEQQEIAKQAKYAEEEKAVLEAEEKAQEQPTGEQPSEKKTTPKKAKKTPRKSKDIAYTYCPNGTDTITLTTKQVDFIRHIPDTCFYEHGLDSTPWCDVLADEIGGQFAGKPMTVGAMISTLREKGIICVCIEKVNGKKAKYFVFTDVGKQVAKELGLE